MSSRLGRRFEVGDALAANRPLRIRKEVDHHVGVASRHEQRGLLGRGGRDELQVRTVQLLESLEKAVLCRHRDSSHGELVERAEKGRVRAIHGDDRCVEDRIRVEEVGFGSGSREAQPVDGPRGRLPYDHVPVVVTDDDQVHAEPCQRLAQRLDGDTGVPSVFVDDRERLPGACAESHDGMLLEPLDLVVAQLEAVPRLEEEGGQSEVAVREHRGPRVRERAPSRGVG